MGTGSEGHTRGAGSSAHVRRPALRVALILLGAVLLQVLTGPALAFAEGPDAIMTPAGYALNAIPRGDDTSNLVVNLPFTMDWNGTSFTQIYINMNGNCTFGSGYTGYNPSTTLAATNRNMMAPFWADVDTRNTAAAQVTYSDTSAGNVPQVDGRNAFFVNWIDVARYNNQATPTNSFQLVLVDRSDTGAGNFDFIFNYDKITWDIATAASTVKARAGWGQAGTGFELPGSGTAQASTSTLLDSSAAATSLIQNSMNSGGQLGRYVFQVRNGQAPNIPPQLSVVDAVLEGNAPGCYAGYTGAADVTAFDPDGTVTLTSDLPVPLPLGVTTVTWTATDNGGEAATAVQTIVVQDSEGPVNTTLVSPSHTTGVWTTDTTVTVDSDGTTDICAGVSGVSYSWSQDAPALPDATLDPSTAGVTFVDVPVVVDRQSFPDAVWPTDWTRTTYVRLTNTSGRTHGTYAAEIYANSNTRRTADFYRDYDLTGYSDATLSVWVNAVMSGAPDYARVEYSTNGGTNYTQLQNLTATTAGAEYSFALPVGGVVRVRFSGSFNRSTEYANWDDIAVVGQAPVPVAVLSTTTTSALADGTWYFNLHAVDYAGNWSAPVNMGPFLIDTSAPVTSDNAPDDWSAADVPVTLTALDPNGVVATTLYSVNGGPIWTYAGPVLVSAEGTTTIQYWSIDEAGNIESPRTTAVRIDRTPPTVPDPMSASALTTSSVEVTWTPSADLPSGVAYYEVYRDGAVVATTTATSFVDTGLTAGQTYVYTVVAVDRADNPSAHTPPASVLVPTTVLWMSLSSYTVDTGAVDPGMVSTVTSATAVTVGGYGVMQYELSCIAGDFANADPFSPTPTLGINVMSYATRGWVTLPLQQFGLTPHIINTATGDVTMWQHDYVFDYSIDTPWTCEPGTYTTTVTYTLVLR